MGTTLRRKHKKSGDSGFESRAGFSPVTPQTRWPNGKAPDYGCLFLREYTITKLNAVVCLQGTEQGVLSRECLPVAVTF
jgi:hypothetical protein